MLADMHQWFKYHHQKQSMLGIVSSFEEKNFNLSFFLTKIFLPKIRGASECTEIPQYGYASRLMEEDKNLSPRNPVFSAVSSAAAL